jgi:outer membrane beta-barrel protein
MKSIHGRIESSRGTRGRYSGAAQSALFGAIFVLSAHFTIWATPLSAIAEDAPAAPTAGTGTAAPPAAPTSGPKSQKLDVESIKKKYWAQGNESEMAVVQNRLYTKEGKLELGVFYANQVGDPFLVIRNAGGTLAYHFTEEWALSAVGWKSWTRNSTAYDAFVAAAGADTGSDDPKYFVGGEVVFSPIYGKLSLIGKAILYYDLHVMVGAGSITQLNGSYLAPLLGIGQQIYLNKTVALRLDYRWMTYNEILKNRITGAPLASSPRRNYTDVISLGFSFLF